MGEKLMSETSDVVTPTITALNGIPGVVAYRLHSGRVKVRGGYMRNNEPGAPDIFAVVKGVPVFFEAKSATGELSDDQTAEAFRISRAGAQVWCIRSVHEALKVARRMLGIGLVKCK
jgi:hypothetical protein